MAAVKNDRAPARGKYDRSKNKRQRAEEQRLRLLEATGQMIAQHGYAGTTVQQICERAGMSRATFYSHFRDLRRAMLKLHDFAASFAFSYVSERLAVVEDPFERLREGVRAFLGLIAEHGDMARVVFREIRSVGPEYETRREAEVERFAALLEEGVRDAFARGLVATAPDPVVVYALVAATEAVAMRYVARGEAERALEAEPMLVDLVFRAFR
jgi:AcrR family transcriptional regulator